MIIKKLSDMEKTKREKILLIDMDRILVDFDSGVRRTKPEILSIIWYVCDYVVVAHYFKNLNKKK